MHLCYNRVSLHRKEVILVEEIIFTLWTTLLAPALLTILRWYLGTRSKK